MFPRTENTRHLQRSQQIDQPRNARARRTFDIVLPDDEVDDRGDAVLSCRPEPVL